MRPASALVTVDWAFFRSLCAFLTGAVDDVLDSSSTACALPALETVSIRSWRTSLSRFAAVWDFCADSNLRRAVSRAVSSPLISSRDFVYSATSSRRPCSCLFKRPSSRPRSAARTISFSRSRICVSSEATSVSDCSWAVRACCNSFFSLPRSVK